MREDIEVIDRNNILRKYYEIRKLINTKNIVNDSGVDESTYYRILNKDYFPNLRTILKLETAFKNRLERIKQCLESF